MAENCVFMCSRTPLVGLGIVKINIMIPVPIPVLLNDANTNRELDSVPIIFLGGR